MPVGDRYQPDPRHTTLGRAFFDPVAPATFPDAKIRFRNDRWAARVGLDALTDAEWAAHFAGFAALPGNLSEPLALRYHGHQFRHYNPDLGDGRGFLFAQMRDTADNRLLDLGTKGSGQTPYSRDGDGRLTLKGGVREALATEYLEALGCYTSKTFSLIETGEPLFRNDEPSPTRSAVMVRLGHSHVRIGTFQRLAFLQQRDEIETLLGYVRDVYGLGATSAGDDLAAAVLADAARNIAHMAAEWYVAGFVHGVLNTDNTTLTGESFDYGPWRFLPTLDVTHTAAYFDQTGLYAFGRQPGALHWNLQRLADCLLPNSTEAALTAALNTFGDHFEARLTTMTLARLGRAVPADGDLRAASELVQSFYRTLHGAQLPFEQTFFDLFGLDEARWSKASAAEAYASGDWPALLGQLAALPDADGLDAARATDYFAGPTPETLVIDEVEALWAPIAADDNWQPLNAKLDRIRAMGSAYAPLLPPRAGHVPIG